MQPINKPFTRLSNNTWLHERPDTDVYRLLIDAYRLRVEDEYKFDGNIEEDSIYTGAQDGLNGFRRFLGLVESHRELLPSWWSPTKRELCENLGMDASQWHDLRCAVEKSDIIEHYGDQQFPMQLRMFAETVIGRGIGGADGTQMKELMVSVEGGSMDGMHSTLIDATTMKTSEM
jgi:splicing suppressor protein 51